MGLSRDGDIVELDDAPCFDYGQKVRSRRTVRNDGTFPGREIGEILVKKGEEGYVTSIGTFLQQFYIYGVDFVARGYRVGMKAKELEPADTAPGGGRMIEPHQPKYQWGQRVRACADLYNDGSHPEGPARALLVPVGATGEIVQVGTHLESSTPVYLVAFGTSYVLGCLEEEIAPL